MVIMVTAHAVNCINSIGEFVIWKFTSACERVIDDLSTYKLQKQSTPCRVP